MSIQGPSTIEVGGSLRVESSEEGAVEFGVETATVRVGNGFSLLGGAQGAYFQAGRSSPAKRDESISEKQDLDLGSVRIEVRYAPQMKEERKLTAAPSSLSG